MCRPIRVIFISNNQFGGSICHLGKISVFVKYRDIVSNDRRKYAVSTFLISCSITHLFPCCIQKRHPEDCIVRYLA